MKTAVTPSRADTRSQEPTEQPIAVEALLAALRAVAEPTRLRILGLLSSGELTVSELTQILRQSQPRVSRHLKLLCEAGVLNRFREGTWVFYRLADGDGVGAMARDLLGYLSAADKAMELDRVRLAEVRAARGAAAAAYFRANAKDWDRIRSLHVPEEQVEERLLAIVGKKPIGDLLDVGTGTGRMLELFAKYADHAVGIDLSRDMLALARANIERKGFANCQVRLGDMYDLALADQSMDLVLFHQVLHFADDPLAAIRETARILRPGGRVVVVDFSPHEFEFLRDEQAHRRLGFSHDEVKGWFRAARLEPETVEDLKGKGKKLTVTIWSARKSKHNREGRTS
ncbi:MAG: metalloregulator ArsR/SmtB family transcription factor [Sphingomonadales bacterium]|nr:metalloregulator ArsR/SmtB family transcription factor [Sphingomonadales bacterium]